MLAELINRSFDFLAGAFLMTVVLSPPLIFFLKRFGVVRLARRDFSDLIHSRKSKVGTPIFGGIIIVGVISFFTILFNWHRETTFVPLGVLWLSAILGGADDLLNIFYKKERHPRTLGRIARLIAVHKKLQYRVWYLISFPWQAYKRFFYLLGSHPGRGVQAHEKIIIQLAIGGIIAWWLSFKLAWTELWIPWLGHVDLGLLIIPVIIFLVVFMANAVNITDGIDGLSAGTLIISYSAFFMIALQQNSFDITLLIATVLGALGGYLLFNIKPAKYQMGDVASLGMGVLLVAVAFALDRPILLPIIGMIFIIEISSVILQTFSKVLLGKRFLKMAPLHHHFEIIGMQESSIVMYAWALAGLFAVLGVWFSFQ
jgi:phospho-N-acetylmuramoyl-pentapeptide-transferase